MKPQTLKDYTEGVLRALLFIQERLDEELSLEELAELAHFSPYHFHRIFRGMVGESLKAHIRRLRLERGALRLLHSEHTVIEVALEAGYETHEAFSRAFKSMFLVSPSRYREEKRPLKFPAIPSGVHYFPAKGVTQFTRTTAGERSMEVTIKKLEKMDIAFVRHIGPYKECRGAWEKLCGALGAKGLLNPPGQFVGVCYDDPDVTPEDKIRYDASMILSAPVEPEGELGVQSLGGGEYAMAVHKGPYEKLSETYAYLCGVWAPEAGRALQSEPSLEFYLNDPQQTPPEELLTEVYIPLDKATE